MPEGTYHFPNGFLWGTSTSAYQVEGGNLNNNWSEWEKLSGKISNYNKAGMACDWWGGRWQEDMERAKDGGQNAIRISIEWSRIQPKPNSWDESAIEYYRQILKGITNRGLFPLVTLHHFTEPIWFSEMGGWENEKAVHYFEIYAGKVVESLSAFASTWITINEPNIIAIQGYLLGQFPPGKKDLKACLQSMVIMAKAHAAAYHKIHQIQPEAKVGIAINYRGFTPERKWLPFDTALSKKISALYNDFFPTLFRDGSANLLKNTIQIPQARNTQDILGINYYTKEVISFDIRAKNALYARRSHPTGASMSPNHAIASQPRGLFEAIRWGTQFKKPILITENGTEDPKDDFRQRYMVSHIHQMWKAVNFNFPVRGYFHWTLVDSFEWTEGWGQKYGLWSVNPDTQMRRKRPSADLYAEICRVNGLSSATIKKHTPDLMKELFPEY
jgi:beta-glucosidase